MSTLSICSTGRDETVGEVLKSLLAIYIYRFRLQEFKDNPDDPVDFFSHLYQPEKDIRTNEYIHHREDHNHLLKRIIACLREGNIPNFNLRCLRDALHDSATGLTYEALTGKNKQSVPDCERIISRGVVEFMERNGHVNEAKVLRILRNWHKAVDGRGLSEDERSTYLAEMKAWLLDDWMPWDRTESNYSLIDVNR
jgi:hypothetical protein